MNGIVDLLGLAVVLSGFYFFIAFFLGLFPEPKIIERFIKKPRVAVLIAMRNEQNYIADCLASLKEQTYSAQLYDVLVLNDASTDDSPQIAKRFTEENSHIKLIDVKDSYAGLTGKMNVLTQGLKQINHEIVLITDADCVVPVTWIENMVRYFTDHVGLVGGFTSLFPFREIKISKDSKNLFARVQALDWAFLQTMNAFNSNAGKPISILGNNFGFRLKAYQQVGGFEKIGFSVTEDFALMEAIRRQTDWKIIHTIDPKTAIYSHPLPDLKSFFQQRLRWIKGGRSMRPWGYFVTIFSVITHLAVIANLLLNQVSLFNLVPFLLLFTADLMVLLKPLRRLKIMGLLKDFLFFEIFYFVYLLIFSVFGIFNTDVIWKDRKLN